MVGSPGDDDLEHQAAGESLAESRQDIVRILSFSLPVWRDVRGRVYHTDPSKHDLRTRTLDSTIRRRGEEPMPGRRCVVEPDHPLESLDRVR